MPPPQSILFALFYIILQGLHIIWDTPVVSYFNDLVGALGDYLIAKYEDFHTVAPSDEELQTFTVELFDHNYRNPKEFRFADLCSVPKQ